MTDTLLQIWLGGAALIIFGSMIFFRLESGEWSRLEFGAALLIGLSWPIALGGVVIGRTLMLVGAPK